MRAYSIRHTAYGMRLVVFEPPIAPIARMGAEGACARWRRSKLSRPGLPARARETLGLCLLARILWDAELTKEDLL